MMNKKRKQPPQQPEKRAYIAVKRVKAPDCNMCKALLPLASPPRQQNTEIYKTIGRVRYWRCVNCGHNDKFVPPMDIDEVVQVILDPKAHL